jgi:hypothetical protein
MVHLFSRLPLGLFRRWFVVFPANPIAHGSLTGWSFSFFWLNCVFAPAVLCGGSPQTRRNTLMLAFRPEAAHLDRLRQAASDIAGYWLYAY